jgi:hypothetical protein
VTSLLDRNKALSMPISPYSLTTTAVLAPSGLSSRARMRVVFPEPKKPVTAMTGSRGRFEWNPVPIATCLPAPLADRCAEVCDRDAGSPRPSLATSAVLSGGCARSYLLPGLVGAPPGRPAPRLLPPRMISSN